MLSLNFANTNEAVKFGLAHKGEEKTIRLMKLFLSGINMAKKEVMDKDDQAYLNLICKGQFVREAIETAQGEEI